MSQKYILKNILLLINILFSLYDNDLLQKPLIKIYILKNKNTQIMWETRQQKIQFEEWKVNFFYFF